MLRWLAWWRPPCLLRLCIVNTVSDPDAALRCIVWSGRGAWLVLRQVAILKGNQAPAPIDGEVVIHRANVAFIQVLP